mmetsp:Transcript_41890/g.47402  ORF Transcript_41890/g.47402 Transcript_41890/m.47402 type:complete len:413 (-) Transcript_41890:130-1368(-)
MTTSILNQINNSNDIKIWNDNALIDCSKIIALNNEGSTSLMSGDIALSISLFCQALHTSKSCLGRRDEQRKQQHEQRQRDRDDRVVDDDLDYNSDNDHDDGHDNEYDPSSSSSSSSSSVPRFDIGHLMDFGLNDSDIINDEVTTINNNSSSSKMSLSDAFSSPSCPERRNENNNSNSKDVVNEINKREEKTATAAAAGDFIYNRPIHVPESFAHHTGLQRSEVILPSIVIFNLALAHHLWAMKKEKEDKIVALSEQQVQAQSQKKEGVNNIHVIRPQAQHSPSLLLKKAAKLYGLAIQLQEGQMVSEGPQSYSKLFFLSCINNLGNSHRLLGDTASSEKIFQQLLTMLMYLNYSEQQQGDTTTTMVTTSTTINNGSTTNNNNMNNTSSKVCRISESFFRNIFQTEVNAAPAA